jgi:hypothetical protein
MSRYLLPRYLSILEAVVSVPVRKQVALCDVWLVLVLTPSV